jgi:glycosyltransferase involved in cell wall biosynthesis
MVEAMLAAKPVIATRVGSMPEAIIHQETGWLIEKNHVGQLTEAIRQLRDRPELRYQLGEQARQRAIAQFTATTMAQHYQQLWQRLRDAPVAPRLKVPRPKD